MVNPVNPARAGLTVDKSSRFPPLGLGIVAALTPEPWEVVLIDENWTPFTCQEADLVGITAFTASVNRAYEIAALYGARGVPVVMGGIHASMCCEEALRFVKAVVIGEAETVWPQVLADVEAGRLQPIYRGTWDDLNDAPWPRRDLFHPDYAFATVQTSRGCPMDCEFCSVTAFNGRCYRRRPPEETLAELESIPQKMLFFVDDNIIGYGEGARAQALATFRGMVERKMDKLWFCQASLNFADDEEVLHWAARAGCKMVFLGLEAEETDALEEANKLLNLKLGIDFYEEAFRRIHRAGIAVLGAFIFGLDGDTPEKLKQRAEYIINSGVDAVQAALLTPLPGTRLFERFGREERLLYTDFPRAWDYYDLTEVVHRPATMDAQRLAEIVETLQDQIFALPALLRKAKRTLKETQDATATRFAWNANISYRKVREEKRRRKGLKQNQRASGVRP